jgi:hypothetical protein
LACLKLLAHRLFLSKPASQNRAVANPPTANPFRVTMP